MGAEWIITERWLDLCVIINLAVEYNYITARYVFKRLIGSCRQINDGKPPMTEAHFTIYKESLRIGATVTHGIRHPFNLFRIYGILPVQYACNATHFLIRFFRYQFCINI